MASLGYPVNSKNLEIDHNGAITQKILEKAMQRPNTQFETITLHKNVNGILSILARCEDWGPLRRLKMSPSTECKSALWTFLTPQATSHNSPINTLVLEFKTGAFLPSNCISNHGPLLTNHQLGQPMGSFPPLNQIFKGSPN